MHIIMGEENCKLFEQKYTVLELDTFKIQPSGKEITAYAVVEQIPISDIPRIEQMRDLHRNVIQNYRKKDWNYCTQALEHLFGFWGQELDSFYTELAQRIDKYKEQDPGDSWNGIIEKSITN